MSTFNMGTIEKFRPGSSQGSNKSQYLNHLAYSQNNRNIIRNTKNISFARISSYKC